MLETQHITQLPAINRKVEIEIVGQIGEIPTPNSDRTMCMPASRPNTYRIWVGDSKQGWLEACWNLFNLATQQGKDTIHIKLNFGLVRPIENPEKLPTMFFNIADILNGAVGRKLNTEEFCLVIREAVTAVLGNSNAKASEMQTEERGNDQKQ